MKQIADIVILDADIWTANIDSPKAEALAIKSNKIIAIGQNKDIKNHIDNSTNVIKAYGRSVLPGFIDSHLHLIEGGIYLMQADFRHCSSKEEFQDILLKYYQENTDIKWIIGGNWNNELWGGNMPDKSWIDEIIPHIPVWLTRLDGHTGLANSAAMKIAGIENTTSFVNGGEIKKTQNGELNGLFTDNAIKLITKHIPSLSKKEKIKALNIASNYLLSQGITSVHYMPLFKALDVDILIEANQKKQLKLRIYSGYLLEQLDKLENKNKGNDFLKFGFVKAFADGSLGSQTAHMFEPYSNTENVGFSTLNYDEYIAKIIEADKLDFQIVTHAIGDKATFDVAKSYQKLTISNGNKDRRLRIEHAQMLTDETINIMSENEIIASMQTVHLLDEIDWAEKILGKERLSEAYRTRSLLNRNIKLVLGSDWFVAIPNPMWGIYAAITRSKLSFYDDIGWQEQEKINIKEALYAYTRDAAYASFDEDKKGMLKIGFLADVIILNNNIFNSEPDDLKYIKTETTILDGKIVYQRK